jgi:hypothetical protein
MGPILLGKKIISTTVTDARWLEGHSLMETTPVEIGKMMRYFFDDNTYVAITPVKDPHSDDLLVISRLGTWVANAENQIEVLT